MAGAAADRTEEATHKRLADARRRGQIAFSRDLSSAATLAAALAGLVAFGGHAAGAMLALVAQSLDRARAPSASAAAAALSDGASVLLAASLPIIGLAAAAALLAGFLQTRGLFSLEPCAPRLERLSPLAGLRRIASVSSAVELLKSVVKLLVALAVASAALRAAVPDLVETPRATPYAAAALAAAVTSQVAWTVCGAFAGLAVLDALYQRHRHRKELRMTKQEVRDEHKQSEGDPHHRAERQRLHREVASQGMLADVRRAKVVIVNPEHIAVALAYDEDGEGAPRVIAKGGDALAREIIAVAREAGVPVIRNVPLAHALDRLELGEDVPEALYEAVAEVLHFVERLAQGAR